MTLQEIVAEAHATALEHGWWDKDAVYNLPEKLALIHSEVSEALEAYRDGEMALWHRNCCDVFAVGKGQHRGGCPGVGKPEGFPSELADVIIRIGDLCGYLGIDLQEAVRTKMIYNKTRPYRHGGKIA